MSSTDAIGSEGPAGTDVTSCERANEDAIEAGTGITIETGAGDTIRIGIGIGIGMLIGIGMTTGTRGTSTGVIGAGDSATDASSDNDEHATGDVIGTSITIATEMTAMTSTDAIGVADPAIDVGDPATDATLYETVVGNGT